MPGLPSILLSSLLLPFLSSLCCRYFVPVMPRLPWASKLKAALDTFGESGHATTDSARGAPTMSQAKERTYTEAEIPGKLQEHGLADWYLEDGWLRRKYNTGGWPITLMLVNAIGYLAEQAWHHPDLAVTWGKVWVKLKTHSAGGITDKDFELATRIETIALWKPAADAALDGNPEKFVIG